MSALAVRAVSAVAVVTLLGCSSQVTNPGPGSGDGGAGPPATPGALSLHVDQARVTKGLPTNLLQMSVTLSNGVGGAPVLLDPTFFRIKTSDGLLKLPVLTSAPDVQWIDGKTPAPTDELGGGASFVGWFLQFDVDAAHATGQELTFSGTGSSGSSSGARTATAPIDAIEACTPCGQVCTYLDRDTQSCCDTPKPSGGSCEHGKGVCPGALTLCAGTIPVCADLMTDANNCGACGKVVTNGGTCVGGHPTGGKCVTTCQVNADCQNSCPPSPNSVNCCDTTRVCFQWSGVSCP